MVAVVHEISVRRRARFTAVIRSLSVISGADIREQP